MKTLLLSLVGLLAGHVAAAQLAPADEKAIRAVVAHWDANLNNHRFAEMTTYTTPDITAITPVGMSLRGQQQLVQGLQRIFDKMLKGVPFKSTRVSVRAIAPEVVVATDEVAVGVSYPPDGVNRGNNKVGPSQTLSQMVLVKKSGHWLVSASQVTDINEQAVKVSQAMAFTKK